MTVTVTRRDGPLARPAGRRLPASPGGNRRPDDPIVEMWKDIATPVVANEHDRVWQRRSRVTLLVVLFVFRLVLGRQGYGATLVELWEQRWGSPCRTPVSPAAMARAKVSESVFKDQGDPRAERPEPRQAVERAPDLRG